MSAKPSTSQPPKEVIAPRHVSLRVEVGRDTSPDPLVYGEVRLWLVARDGHSLFAYWEIRVEEHPEACGPSGRPALYLRIYRKGAVETTVPLNIEWHDCTVRVAFPDTLYEAELGFFSPQGVWCFLARSKTARTPPDDDAPPQPPHLTVVENPLPLQRSAWTPQQEKRLSAILKEEIARKLAPKSPPVRKRASSRRLR